MSAVGVHIFDVVDIMNSISARTKLGWSSYMMKKLVEWVGVDRASGLYPGIFEHIVAYINSYNF